MTSTLIYDKVHRASVTASLKNNIPFVHTLQLFLYIVILDAIKEGLWSDDIFRTDKIFGDAVWKSRTFVVI
ncbi:hypothetical protein Back11_15790 [Paenibacillus baekrokdamisoli]|uniref:Uncharacterized protein n=1 Tax=Paenibacillus baekrokdamisoli TaxID=1712516 RepID=A0A3G9JAD9_9BACL|nr:hypothetical protein Back11_15790 [Paenibacillus baekrokdamisoli]